MSFENCINANAKISQSDKNEILKVWQEYKKPYIKEFGAASGESVAIGKFTTEHAQNLQRAREAKALTAEAWFAAYPELQKRAANFDALKNKNAASKVLYAGSNRVRAVSQYLEDQVFTKASAIQRTALTAIGESIEKYRAKMGGTIQDVGGFKNVATAIIKQDFSGDVGAHAKAFKEVFQSLKERYVKAGGVMGDIEGYFPQRFVMEKLKNVSKADFIKDMRELLDFKKMEWMDDVGIEKVKIDEILSSSYKKIVTGNLEEISRLLEKGEPVPRGIAAISKKYRNERVFHYKNADAYLKMNEKYGVGDEGLFDLAVGHIAAMSRDVALLESMGANADANFSRMRAFAATDGATISQTTRLDNMWKVAAGRTSFDGEVSAFYKAYEGISAFNRMSKLGKAAVGALADMNSVRHTARLNGLPSTQFMKNYFKYLNPANTQDRNFARINLRAAQAAHGISFNNTRFVDDSARGGKLNWMAQFVHTMGGLAHVTDAGQTATIVSTTGFFAEAKRTKLKYEELDDAMLEAFDRFMITKEDYENILKADLFEDTSGVMFLRPEEAYKISPKSAEKYNTWLSHMMSASTNEATLLTRAIATGGERRGTSTRALRGTIMMFKSFGFAMMQHHLLPAMRDVAAGKKGAILDLSAFLGGSLMAGAFVQQLYQIIDGKTPRDMDSGKFWGQAMAQGGGLAIFSNILFADYSGLDGALQSTLLGPNAGLAESMLGLTIGNITKAADPNKEATIGADLATLIRQSSPDMWWNELFLNRMVMDNISRFLDSEYDNKLRRKERKMQEDYGQNWWWNPS